MLQPLIKPTGRRVSPSTSYPSPRGGWNARDSLADMDPGDAVALENWFPRPSDVITRGGFEQHCATGEADTVDTLAEWISGSSRKLLAGVNGKIIDVSSATPSTLGTGFSADRWNTANFSGRLFFVNGTDTPQTYDGSTLASSAWSGSGLTATDLEHVITFKSRLYFVEKNSQSFWYGGVGSVTGTLTEFDLSQVGQYGGRLVCLGVITTDGGSGADDLFVAIMSSGDTIVYQGSNPGDATTWTLVGVFRIGAPISNQAIAKIGSELLVVTRDGYVPLTRVFPFGRSSRKSAISDKIVQAAVYAVQSYGANSGWQIILYPKAPAIYINVPAGSSAFQQHVMNLDTGAWCKFTGMNAYCWALYNDSLYFGGAAGKVFKADTGYDDDGTAISTDAQTAWNHMRRPGQIKRFTAAKPIMLTNGDPGVQAGCGVDFEPDIPTVAVSGSLSVDSAIWDQAIWDVAIWGGLVRAFKSWQSIANIGEYASLRVRTSNDNKQVQWMSTTWLFEPGGPI